MKATQPSKRLLLFTSSFPYGKNEPFLEEELQFLAKYFLEIEIFPFYYNSKITKARQVSNNVIYNKPVIPLKKYKRILYFMKAIIKLTPIKFLLADFFQFNIYLSKIRIGHWIFSFIDFCILWDSPHIKRINNIQNSIFYFYWGANWALSLYFLNKNNNNTHFIRLHGGEVYFNKNSKSIQMRLLLFKNTNYLLPISEHLKDYLIQYYHIHPEKVLVSRIGTRFIASNPTENSTIFKFVSVSNLIPLKRVHLIIEVLSKIEDNLVEWYHFGDGTEMEKLRKLADKTLGKNIKYSFIGHVNKSAIFEFYKIIHIDALINLSQFEGVPVSIMEANSFGIPVVATNVGAVREIVNNDIGELCDENVNLEYVKDILLSTKDKKWLRKRKACYEHWRKYFQADKSNLALINMLKLKVPANNEAKRKN